MKKAEFPYISLTCI